MRGRGRRRVRPCARRRRGRRAARRSSGYEPADVPEASAALDHPARTARWERVELRLDGPRHGNPFVDVELSAEVTDGEITRAVPGFYDGEGTYRVRAIASDWDAPWAGVPGEDMLVYLGFGRPRFRRLFLPPDQDFTVDVIDTWAMTTERLPGTVRGLCTVPLPGRPWMALRITRAR